MEATADPLRQFPWTPVLELRLRNLDGHRGDAATGAGAGHWDGRPVPQRVAFSTGPLSRSVVQRSKDHASLYDQPCHGFLGGAGAQSFGEKTSHGFTNPRFLRVGAQQTALKSAFLSYSTVTVVKPILEW